MQRLSILIVQDVDGVVRLIVFQDFFEKAARALCCFHLQIERRVQDGSTYME